MRAERLGQLAGIGHRMYAEVEGFEKSFAYADEDLDRSTEDRTAAVHFMRFEFSDNAIAGLRTGANLKFGIEDPRLPLQTTTAAITLQALLADFK